MMSVAKRSPYVPSRASERELASTVKSDTVQFAVSAYGFCCCTGPFRCTGAGDWLRPGGVCAMQAIKIHTGTHSPKRRALPRNDTVGLGVWAARGTAAGARDTGKKCNRMGAERRLAKLRDARCALRSTPTTELIPVQ